MITADKNLLKEGSEAQRRLALQRSAVERLDVVYWGRGVLVPKLSRRDYDVVTTQDPLWRGLVGWYLARTLGAKLNVQVHMDVQALSFFKHVVAQIVLRHADSIRVVSEKLKAQVERAGARAKISVLPVFVDLERFRAVLPQRHDGKNILWIGRMEEEKDPLLALTVFSEIHKALPGAKLHMLGSGSLHAALTSRTSGLPVEFKGWQDPAQFLATADLVLSTSRHESWGASIVEALAAGVPVVAPDVGIAREAGAVVAPRECLAEAALRVLISGERGVLRLNPLPAAQWAVQWRNSLS